MLFSDADDYIDLYYNPDTNTFTDEGGFIQTCLYEILTPNDLYLFHYIGDRIFIHRSNPRIQIYISVKNEDWEDEGVNYTYHRNYNS